MTKESDTNTDPRKLLIGIVSIQAVFVIATLSIVVGMLQSQAATSENVAALKVRQEMIESKADRAVGDASKALALSGRAESNIAWIREGLTELKMSRSEFQRIIKNDLSNLRDILAMKNKGGK